jgi:hypothetical protein
MSPLLLALVGLAMLACGASVLPAAGPTPRPPENPQKPVKDE